MVKSRKIRVNITVDKKLLDKAREKLDLFGGKLSTLFNAYLADFVEGMEKNFGDNQKELRKKIEEIDDRLRKMEDKLEKNRNV